MTDPAHRDEDRRREPPSDPAPRDLRPAADGRRAAGRHRPRRHRRALARRRVVHGGARGALARARPRPPAGRQEPAVGRAGAHRRAATCSTTSRARSRTAPTCAARTGMLYGSLLAGIAFGNSGVGAAHALQFVVGAATHTSHGLGTGLLLPYVMEYNRPARPEEIAQLSALAGGDAVTEVHALGLRIGLPASLAEIGVAARSAARDGGGGRGHQAAGRQQPAPARRRRARGDPRRRLARRARRGCAATGWRSVREVAHGALEVRRHPRLGGVHVAGLEHVEHLVVLVPDRRRVTPSSAAAGRRRGGSRRSARRRGARGAGTPPR